MLFGQSTKGLNQTNAGDLESHYVMVAHVQSVVAKPALEKLTSILWLQKGLKSKIPDDWEICFKELWVPTEKENADTEFVKAQAESFHVTALTGLITEQIITPEEARQVVVEELYPEYGFDPSLPDFPEELNYAAGVDTAQMDVPGQQPGQPTQPVPPGQTPLPPSRPRTRTPPRG
jgi:hypothetical protein